MGKLSTQQQAQLEAKARETRRFKTLKEYSEATGQDKHSVLVDYDVFVKVSPPGPDPRTLYRPADFDFELRPGSTAVDAGVRLPGVNDDFTGRAPDLGAYEVGAGAALRSEEAVRNFGAVHLEPRIRIAEFGVRGARPRNSSLKFSRRRR